MADRRYFPQPTQDDLDFEKIHWIGLNPFWWGILQSKIEELTEKRLWLDYSQEIAQAIHDMMTDDETPP